ncbi:hypothetical protein KJ996_00120 [Patescibacteria group bacterium]|nr:hypothetical protein [Patescibacteria group bacterium]
MKQQTAINGEVAVFLVNEHWIKYTPTVFLVIASWLLYVLCLGLSITISDASHISSMTSIVFGHFILLAFHHAAFYNYFCASSRRTLFTTRRILTTDQHPWISDDVTDTPLWRLRSIEVRKEGVIQHLFDYGSLILNRGEMPTIVRVPHPHDVHAQIIPHIQGMQPALEKHMIETRVKRTPSLSRV